MDRSLEKFVNHENIKIKPDRGLPSWMAPFGGSSTATAIWNLDAGGGNRPQHHKRTSDLDAARHFSNRFHCNLDARRSVSLRVGQFHARLLTDRACGCLATTQCQCVSAFRGAAP
jgi:hypothetical protein